MTLNLTPRFQSIDTSAQERFRNSPCECSYQGPLSFSPYLQEFTNFHLEYHECNILVITQLHTFRFQHLFTQKWIRNNRRPELLTVLSPDDDPVRDFRFVTKIHEGPEVVY